MAASPKEKFDAAVNVIQTLPKNVSAINPGQFVPSHSLMLKFYAYYKQATIGPCDIPRPGFWDVIGKAKWDAWNKLGEMAKEEAMNGYVEELKQVLKDRYPQGYDKQEIVEAMPHTEMVQNFVQKLDNFYELCDENSKQNGNVIEQNTIQDPTVATILDPTVATIHDPTVATILQDLEQAEEQHIVMPIKSAKRYLNGDSSSSSSPNHTESSPAHYESSPAHFESSPTHINGGYNGVTSSFNDDRLLGDSDSEGEEFCDTSDSPDSQTRPTVYQPITPVNQWLNQGLGPTHISHSSNEFSAMIPETDMLMMRGDTPGGAPSLARQGSSQSVASQGRASNGGNQPPTSRRSHLLSAGGGSGSGGGGSHGNSGGGAPYRPDVNEQIAAALIRLQQDMSSVLTRLNTLETLTVAQHHRSRSRGSSSSSQHGSNNNIWWWPFGNIQARTVFLILVWPFIIVNWIIRILSRRRNRHS